MKRSNMRSIVRRRLLDEGARQRFSDGDINTMLNVGAQQVQGAIDQINKNAFRKTELRNLVADEYRYAKPRGILRLKKFYLDYDGDGTYVAAKPTTEEMIEDPVKVTQLRDQGGSYFVFSGGEFLIFPTPAEDATDGIKIVTVPVLAMDDDDDDLEDMGLVESLHMAVVLWAVKLLLPEDSEDTKMVEAEIAKIMEVAVPVYAGAGITGALEYVSVVGIGGELGGVP